jgi:hypothetical protein
MMETRLLILPLLIVCCLSYRLVQQHGISRATSATFRSAATDSNNLNSKKIMNKYSRTITEPPSQGASQAMLYATGLTSETITSPQV